MKEPGAFDSNGRNHATLPEPNVEIRSASDKSEWTEAQVRGVVCNPVNAGIGPFPVLVDDQTWVRAAAVAIDKDGKEQFLVNMLHLLRQSFQDTVLKR